MVTLDNIRSILKSWDVWKRIEAAPSRIDELEMRVAALEAKLKRAPVRGGAPGHRALRPERNP